MHSYSSGGDRTPAHGAIAVLAVAVAVLGNWLADRYGVGPAWLISPPAVAGAYGLLYQSLERWGWKSDLLHAIGLVNVPVIQGTYEGVLQSSYENTVVGVRLTIDQTWTRLAVRFEVLEPKSSTSHSVSASLTEAGHDHARLIYTYKNQPNPTVAAPDLRDHDGTAEVVIDNRVGTVEGRYFNFRGRQGSLELRRV